MALILIFCAGFLVDSIDFGGPQLVILTQADAYVHGSHRRVARRTSRRTARRVSNRHSYYRAPGVVYGAGAVAATATAIAILNLKQPSNLQEGGKCESQYQK